MAVTEQNRINSYWTNRANSYSEKTRKDMSSFKKAAYRELLRKYTESGDKHVLELGAGPGFLSILMAETGFSVTVTDSSREMVEEANIEVQQEPNKENKR